MKKIIGIIPSRFASTRLPGKALKDIEGKSMIQRVYEQAKKSSGLSHIVVATDHDDIYNHIKDFGGEVCMTRTDHASGTDRCYEALTKQKEPFDYVVNIQGDEPFIQPDQIDLLAGRLDGHTEIATLIKRIDNLEQLLSLGEAKVVFNRSNEEIGRAHV